MNGRIKRVAYVNWAGIDYDDLELDQGPFTGLVGITGAGKTTLVTCLAYALLPDRKALNLQPISNVSDPSEAGKDRLAEWISKETNYAYVALDIAGRHGKRLIAGIYVQVVDARAELTPWVIEDAPSEAPLNDFLVIVEGGHEYTPVLRRLAEQLAKHGITLHVCPTVGDYGEYLYAAGVSPTTLRERGDRSLYGQLVASTFQGGISAQVASTLKEYILPEARRIPETVKKVREVTQQVVQTRRSLEHANRMLALLETTYVAGKRVTLRAIQTAVGGVCEAQGLHERYLSDHEVATRQEAEARAKVASLQQELDVTGESKRNLKQNKEAEQRRLDALLEPAQRTTEERKTAYDRAKGTHDDFAAGKDIWHLSAGVHGKGDYETAKKALESEVEEITKAITLLEQKQRGLEEEQKALAVAAGDAKVSALTAALGGTALAETLGEVSEKEAVRLELAMGGLTAGVVGPDMAKLATLQPSPALPEFFWIGENAPTARNATEIGAWLAMRGNDGYFVTNKEHRPVFGAAAREKRKAMLGDEIAQCVKQINGKWKDRNLTRERLSSLQESRNIVLVYLAHRHDGGALLSAEVARAKREYDAAQAAFTGIARAVRELNERYNEQNEQYQKQVAGIVKELERQQDAAKNAATAAQTAQANAAKAAAQLGRAYGLVDEIKLALGVRWPFLEAEASSRPPLDATHYGADQTRDLMALQKVVEDEPARLELFQRADALDPSSCVRLWPMLLDIVHDRIAISVADTDGEDYLKEMQARRDGLAKDLADHENEVQVHAREIHTSILSEIKKQEAEIRRMSRLAEHLQFGNVVGMRVRMVRKQKLLDLLEAFSGQQSLFTEDIRNFEEVLADFFSQQLNLKLAGEELLDYRSFVDIAIEVQRKWDKEWHHAASLSGGEAIGGGLAISLILYRSLATRGGGTTNLRPDQITPLFAVDEMMRLDDAGQAVAVEFGERQGFQLVVTAPKLSPDYRCTLWSIVRFVHEGRPRVEIRGVRRTRAASANEVGVAEVGA